MSGFNSIASKSIPNGTKIVAIFGDGSGARLFLIDDVGNILDAEDGYPDSAPDTTLLSRGYTYWMEIPMSFKLWFENHHD